MANTAGTSGTSGRKQKKQGGNVVAVRFASESASALADDGTPSTAPASSPSHVLPFGLQPAPRRAIPLDTLPVVDLGAGGLADESWTGWCIIYDPDAPLSVFDDVKMLMQARDADLSVEDRLSAFSRLEEFLAKILLAWNFVDNASGVPLPQPRDGGAKMCPRPLVVAIARGFNRAVAPPKA